MYTHTYMLHTNAHLVYTGTSLKYWCCNIIIYRQYNTIMYTLDRDKQISVGIIYTQEP